MLETLAAVNQEILLRLSGEKKSLLSALPDRGKVRKERA